MRRHASALAFAMTLAISGCASTGNPTVARDSAVHIDVPTIARPAGESAAWWFRSGAAQAAERGAMAGHAKNVIVFLGDGMSLPTVAAARIFEGQRKGGSGEENRLAWETFPATALSKTYNTNSQTPDSAGTMSAIATGVKTRLGVLSIAQDPVRKDCAGALAAPMLTLWELATSSGMATGVVTTTRVTDATPAATFSHSAERNWENDTDLTEQARADGCIDIARQMVESAFGNGPNVLMGGGRDNFMTAAQRDPEYADKTGLRQDGRDIIAEWQARHPRGTYVWNARQLADAPLDTPLLALFQPGHMRYEHDRPQDPAGEPSLAEMTRAAIARLSRGANGYVLLVEGGNIDKASHAGNAYRALSDTVALSDAVRAATEMTSSDDTLILVTADHSHTLMLSGYARRGNAIMDKVHGGHNEAAATIDPSALARDATGLPYTTLNYASGPGYIGASEQQPEGPKHFPHTGKEFVAAKHGRPDLTDVDTEDPDYLQEALFPLGSETHGGDDVGIWASGPGSNAVRGSLEQNAIFHILLQATPRLRGALCAKGDCDANGVPVALPKIEDFRPLR
ncbi:alkaline phosphatase [Thermomonas sp. HDW16]|uniref:alkaline phosphatase n=1 Tax=Thermomonas sp. HDW16 TaxID=2714945 RepID=UPI001407ECCA|nr:alkaline phosphatase [Thermomonas sp. HDW16]QIL21154.1 alkaline phosphatase [Thermomonas sp. HDW16]